VKTDYKLISVCSLVAFVVSFVFYYKFLDNFFVYDDFKYIENMFNSPLSVVLGYGNLRVVSNAVWWPLYALSGLNPFIYNLFGVVMHTANAVLLGMFLMRLIKDKYLAIICGAIFLINSVGCDALFWKAANNTLINVFWYLITLYLYVLYRQEGLKKYFLLSATTFVLAMFSKEDAASMPFIILLLELVFFDGLKDKKGTIVKVIPYVAIILVYIFAGKLIFNFILHTSVEHAKFFKIRPLHSIFAGWSVFFLSPQGDLTLKNPAIYLTALGIILSFFWVKNKRLLYFGYGWIFLAFLPQSFTTLGQFDPKYIFNSISRYLYITSIGSSIILGAVLISVRERFTSKVFYCVIVIFFTFFIVLNYKAIQTRGAQWRDDGEPTALFLRTIKKEIPSFPPNTYIYVVDAPTGRAYVQQSLRAFYGNLGITWIVDPNSYKLKKGETAYVVVCSWKDNGTLDLDIRMAH
jgi:hypothetical protein